MNIKPTRWHNLSVNRTAQKLRFLVPFALWMPVTFTLSRTLRARDNGAADYDPLVARREAPHNHADQPDIARPKLRFVRARRLSAAPFFPTSNG